jgi:hypothetical protein
VSADDARLREEAKLRGISLHQPAWHHPDYHKTQGTRGTMSTNDNLNEDEGSVAAQARRIARQAVLDLARLDSRCHDSGLYEEPVFDDPPKPPRRDGLRLILEKVAVEPGRWARVADFASKKSAHETASRVRTGNRGVIPGIRWESCVRPIEDGRWGMWVRAHPKGDGP